MAFLVATTSLPEVYRPNGYARTTTAGTPHARANCSDTELLVFIMLPPVASFLEPSTARQEEPTLNTFLGRPFFPCEL